MSLKDNIELIRQIVGAFTPKGNWLGDTQEALSRIEDALSDMLAQEQIQKDLAKKRADWRSE